MDIEDEDAIGGDGRGVVKHTMDSVGSKIKKKRSRNVQIADELMKKSLKPYFVRKKITKDEYKDIMKRGVAKLSKREFLRPEKVEKFVKNYVNAVMKERRSIIRRPPIFPHHH
jgi:hypothetical protein